MRRERDLEASSLGNRVGGIEGAANRLATKHLTDLGADTRDPRGPTNHLHSRHSLGRHTWCESATMREVRVALTVGRAEEDEVAVALARPVWLRDSEGTADPEMEEDAELVEDKESATGSVAEGPRHRHTWHQRNTDAGRHRHC